MREELILDITKFREAIAQSITLANELKKSLSGMAIAPAGGVAAGGVAAGGKTAAVRRSGKTLKEAHEYYVNTVYGTGVENITAESGKFMDMAVRQNVEKAKKMRDAAGRIAQHSQNMKDKAIKEQAKLSELNLRSSEKAAIEYDKAIAKDLSKRESYEKRFNRYATRHPEVWGLMSGAGPWTPEEIGQMRQKHASYMRSTEGKYEKAMAAVKTEKDRISKKFAIRGPIFEAAALGAIFRDPSITVAALAMSMVGRGGKFAVPGLAAAAGVMLGAQAVGAAGRYHTQTTMIENVLGIKQNSYQARALNEGIYGLTQRGIPIGPSGGAALTRKLAQTGYRGAALGQVRGASGMLYVATAGELSPEESSDAIRIALRGFQQPAKYAEHYVNVMLRAANASAIEFKEMAKMYSVIGGQGKFANQDIETVSAVMAAVRNVAGSGPVAAHQTRQLLTRLTAPNIRQLSIWQELGLKGDVLNADTGDFKGMLDILAAFESKIGKSGDKATQMYLRNRLYQEQGKQGALSISGFRYSPVTGEKVGIELKGWEAVKHLIEDMKKDQTLVKEYIKRNMGTMWYQSTMFKSQFEQLNVNLGRLFLPSALKLMETANRYLNQYMAGRERGEIDKAKNEIRPLLRAWKENPKGGMPYLKGMHPDVYEMLDVFGREHVLQSYAKAVKNYYKTYYAERRGLTVGGILSSGISVPAPSPSYYNPLAAPDDKVIKLLENIDKTLIKNGRFNNLLDIPGFVTNDLFQVGVE